MKIKRIGWSICLLLAVLCVVSCEEGTVTDAPDGVEDAVIQTEVHEHTPADAVRENEVEPTCSVVGTYEEVVYCSECHTELSRTEKEIPTASHMYEGQSCKTCGAEKTSEGLTFLSNGNGTCSVSGLGSCKDKNVVIPAKSPAGDRVIAIASAAFQGCAELVSVRVPDTVTGIGDNAFSGCTALQTVTLSDGITKIGASAFANCEKLKSITLPTRVKEIGAKAFFSCKALESIVIPLRATLPSLHPQNNYCTL